MAGISYAHQTYTCAIEKELPHFVPTLKGEKLGIGILLGTVIRGNGSVAPIFFPCLMEISCFQIGCLCEVTYNSIEYKLLQK